MKKKVEQMVSGSGKGFMPMNLQFFADGGGGEPQEPDVPAGDPKPGDNGAPAAGDGGGGEVSVESLMAQLAQAKADNAQLKAANDKLCTSEGNLRKQLRAKQTAEEQQAAAEAEQKAQHEEYVKELENFRDITKASKRYLSMGMDPDLAEATATAEIEGDMEKVTSNLTAFMAARDKKKDEEIKAQYASQIPTPQSGNQTQVDYSQQFQQAISVGDTTAAALAILQEADANKGTA